MKTRIWHHDLEKFLTPDEFCLDLNGKLLFVAINSETSLISLHAVSPSLYTVQHCMSIRDKNDKIIYEGDIVSVCDDNNIFVIRFGKVKRNVVSHGGQVVYPVEFNGFYFEAVDNKKPYFSITKNSFGKHDLEMTTILGNIFESPELLK